MVTTRHSGRWTVEDRCASAYRYLPVEVPPGSCGLRAELEYERAGTVLDLGCIGPAGFRGWSGGARRFFVITPDAATPGYLPGELEPGTWHVMIGLHRVPLSGAEYHVTAEVTSTPGRLLPAPPPDPLPPLQDRPPRRELPANAGRLWLAGDLHTHTVHSDGGMTVPELARYAAGQGLDFIAITDHNTISHHAELPAAAAAHQVILVPGQEVTVDAGHAGALGDIGWIDFREPADAWLEATERAGGLLSVNHPIGGHVSWTITMDRRPPLAEVWHWSWLDLHWTTPLAWWLAWDPGAVPVGGSDWHKPGGIAPPGTPTTWVECAGDDASAVLEGLRAGRTSISARRDGPALLRMDGDLVAVAAEGTILTGPGGPVARVRGPLARFPGEPGCHRLIDPAGATFALTP
jgi:PHP domain